jgi:hypothetical protein
MSEKMHPLPLVVPTRIVQDLWVAPIEETLPKSFDVRIGIPFIRTG